MRDAQQLAGVSEADTELVDEDVCGFSRRLLGAHSFLVGPLAGTPTSLDRRSQRARQSDLLVERHRVRIVDPKSERLAKSSPGLLQRLPIRMATANGWNRRKPPTTLIAFEHRLVGLHLSLPSSGERLAR
jgi:hypothetical protein